MMPRDKSKIIKKQICFFQDDYEYLRKLFAKAGMEFSRVIRDLASDMADFYIEVFGTDIEKIEGDAERYLRRIVKLGLLKFAEVVDEARGYSLEKEEEFQEEGKQD